MSTKTEVCKKDGHSFVESSLGRGPKPMRVVHMFCQRCGEVRTIEVPK
jgi:hypothetical protein